MRVFLFAERNLLFGKEWKSREKAKAEARGLFCYWAVRELGHSMLEISGRLAMSQPGVVYAVRRGERIANERGIKLTH
jgi:putative transposase